MHAGLANDQDTVKLTLPAQIQPHSTTVTDGILRNVVFISIAQLLRSFNYKLHSNVQGNGNSDQQLDQDAMYNSR